MYLVFRSGESMGTAYMESVATCYLGWYTCSVKGCGTEATHSSAVVGHFCVAKPSEHHRLPFRRSTKSAERG